MNISRVISSIRTSLNLNMITLPFKDNDGRPLPTELVLREVIQTVTIPEYSEFVPNVRETVVPFEQLQCVDQQRSIYLLPPELCITPIKYVINIKPPEHTGRAVFGDITPAYGINRSVQGVITSQAYMMLAGQMRQEPTFDYLGKNRVKLYGYPKIALEIVVAAEHDPDGESIEDSCFDSFMELALLDTKIFLYNTLKYYESIPSAFGTLSLKSDDYQTASSDRDQLLEKWRDTFHLDLPFWEWM